MTRMRRLLDLLLTLLFALPLLALHSTDTITSTGNPSRSGHEPNHKLDPNVIKSGSFGELWRTKGLGKYNGFTEEFYAQPLVYTPPGHNQSVYVISQQNYAYRLDAATGEIKSHRQLMIPFLTADADGCNDIANCIGSTATGVIDPVRNTWYLTTKTYVDQTKSTPQGLKAGRYFIHALDAVTLESRPGYPVGLEGMEADNAPWRVFEGGKHHQRPALLQINNFIYAGFASHCVQWNFTGWVVGWHADTGDIVAKFATEGGKEKNGKGAGVWMSGGGLASDNVGRMFFATGNGYASQLADTPVPGRQPPTALEEAVVNMAIDETGALLPVDFFMPWEKRDLDGMDKDLGTSGFVLLEPGVFSTASVSRIGTVAGKTGKMYFLDLNNLGGYMMGPGRKDAILQSIQLPGPVFSSAAAYPFEGGYVYVSPVGHQTHVFKFGVGGDGRPVFTEAGKTTHPTAGRQGVGHMAITTLNNEPGTGILWICDVEGTNLRAYGTVPENGVLPTYGLWNNPGQTKFSRPVFGNGRVYLTTHTGYITAFGSPVNIPFDCGGAHDLGQVQVGESKTVTVTCKPLTTLRVETVDLDLETHYSAGAYPELPINIAIGATFTFNATFSPKSVGPLSTNINLRTTNLGPGKYATNTPVVIRGSGVSVAPVLKIQPNVLSFGSTVTGSTRTLTFTIANGGQSPLIINGYKWSTNATTGPFLPAQPTKPYSFTGLPAVGSQVTAESETVVTSEFNPTTDGYHSLYFVLSTNAGSGNVGFFGTSGGPPKAVLEWQLGNGTWVAYQPGKPLEFDGGVSRGTHSTRRLRLKNTGGTTLTTTISKPPVSGPLAASNPLGSIPEGSQIPPGESMSAEVICSPPKGQVNIPPLDLTAIWTFNFDDPTLGKQEVHFVCSGLAKQVGDLDKNGQAYWRYLGCFKDADPGRQLEILAYSRPDSTNGRCLETCQKRGEKPIFAATEYEAECWCGSRKARTLVEEERCNYLCKGDFQEYCGGEGTLMSIFYDSRRWNPGMGDPAGSSSSSTSATPSATSSSTPSTSSTSVTSPLSSASTLSTKTSASSATTLPSPTTPTTPTPLPAGATYLGCYREPPTTRALADDFLYSTAMTPRLCTRYCTSKSLRLAGIEYASECWCGRALHKGAKLEDDAVCSMPCSGDAGSVCRGGSLLSVYNNTELMLGGVKWEAVGNRTVAVQRRGFWRWR